VCVFVFHLIVLFYCLLVPQTLRRMLDSEGFANTRIVAADIKWWIAADILSDPDFAAAVDYIG